MILMIVSQNCDAIFVIIPSLPPFPPSLSVSLSDSISLELILSEICTTITRFPFLLLQSPCIALAILELRDLNVSAYTS